MTATRHDGAVELRSGRKNGSAGVKQKNGYGSRFRAKNLSSRYARAAINFPGTKNRNTRGFSHQTPWSCLLAQAGRHRPERGKADLRATAWRRCRIKHDADTNERSGFCCGRTHASPVTVANPHRPRRILLVYREDPSFFCGRSGARAASSDGPALRRTRRGRRPDGCKFGCRL